MELKGFVERLRMVMGHLGWSQKMLSEKTSISEKSISFWMQEKKKPGMRSIEKISNATGCHPAYLLGKDVEMFEKKEGLRSSIGRHADVGEELTGIYKRLIQLNIEFQKAYPPEISSLKKLADNFEIAVNAVQGVKNYAEDLFLVDHPNTDNYQKLYYQGHQPSQSGAVDLAGERRERSRGRRDADNLPPSVQQLVDEILLLHKHNWKGFTRVSNMVIEESERVSEENLKKINGE